jgi:DNA-binding IclR family transcriptional regulator
MEQSRVGNVRGRRPRPAGDGDGDGAAESAASYTALKGVGRAIEVLEALAERPMRAKDLAEALGLKWTTAYRSLAYLEEQEYLRRDPSSGEYSIGPRLYVLGLAYLVTDPLAPVAPAHLKAASEHMGCAAQANEREGVRVMTVASVDSPTPIRKTSPGFTFPLGVAAKGKLLLAYAPDEVQQAVLTDPLPEFTRHTITEPRALAAELEQIRAHGHAVTREDLQLGVGSVATPIRDRTGAVVGCVSLVVRNDRMNDDRLVADLLATSEDASHEISVALGWRPAAAPA